MSNVAVYDYKDKTDDQPDLADTSAQIEVHCPFNPGWSPIAKMFGGRWHFRAKRWVFDKSQEQNVRAALRLLYGTDGDEQLQTVTVRIHGVRGVTKALYELGREVVKDAVDGEVKLGKNVTCIQVDPIVLEVKKVPRPMADVAVAGNAERFEIVTTKHRRDELNHEIRRLERRLAEIRALRAELG